MRHGDGGCSRMEGVPAGSLQQAALPRTFKHYCSPSAISWVDTMMPCAASTALTPVTLLAAPAAPCGEWKGSVWVGGWQQAAGHSCHD